MNLFDNGLTNLIQLRNSRFKIPITGLIYLECLHFTFRFLLISFAKKFDYQNNVFVNSKNSFLNNYYFNFGQYTEIFTIFSLFPLYLIYVAHQIVFKSDIQIWHPVMTTLTRDNWSQFVENNLNFQPTFSLIKLIKQPNIHLMRWKIVFGLLRNHRQVCFKKPLALFPYLNRQIRVQIIYHFLFYLLTFKISQYVFCKSCCITVGDNITIYFVNENPKTCKKFCRPTC